MEDILCYDKARESTLLQIEEMIANQPNHRKTS